MDQADEQNGISTSEKKMKPDLTTLEGNLAACNRADDLYVRIKESDEGIVFLNHKYAGSFIGKLSPPKKLALLPTKTEIYCREYKRAQFEKMLERVYGFFRRKI